MVTAELQHRNSCNKATCLVLIAGRSNSSHLTTLKYLGLFSYWNEPSLHNIQIQLQICNWLIKRHVSALFSHHQAYKEMVLIKVHSFAVSIGSHGLHYTLPRGSHGLHCTLQIESHYLHCTLPIGSHGLHCTLPIGSHGLHYILPRGFHGLHCTLPIGSHGLHCTLQIESHYLHCALPIGSHGLHCTLPIGSHGLHCTLPIRSHGLHCTLPLCITNKIPGFTVYITIVHYR